mgnify:FL=1
MSKVNKTPQVGASNQTLRDVGYSVETIGHACIVLRKPGGTPVLFTDPWLIGSCYWRSWWLQNYPSEEQISELQKAKFCYITHEHPDHLHLPTTALIMRRLVFVQMDGYLLAKLI